MQFLHYFALVAIAKCVSTHGIISTKKNLYPFDDLPDDVFPNPSPIPETCLKLDIGHHSSPRILSGLDDVERLVIYVYRTKASDDVYVFTPQKRFQPCFPDLASDEEGDLMVIDSIKIQELFNPNFNADPWDYYSDGNKYDFSPDSGDSTGFDYTGHSIVTGIKSIQHDIALGIPNKPSSDSSKLPFLGNAEISINAGDGYDGHEADYYNTGETSVIDSSYFDENMFLPHTQGDKIYTEVVDGFDFNKEKQNVPGLHPIKTADNMFNTVSGGDIFLPFRSLIGNHKTFDDWFMHQLYRFVDYDRLDQNIDVRMLKFQIQKILRENHIFIRNDGILIDHRGTVINPSNLQIRPILIGDSMAYKKLMSMRDDFFSFPSNSPYLDTVVVTQTYPSRLLGIIPLGKTFIPKVKKDPVINPWPRHPHSILSKRKDLISLRYDEKPSPSVVPKKRNVFDEPFHIIKNIRTASDPKGSNETTGSSSTESAEQKTNPLFGFLNTLKGTDSKQLTDILTLFTKPLHMLMGKSGEPVSESEMASEDSESETSDVSEYEELEMDDDLGFKIIGGNPAVSSGTPLSNRGRSAANF